MESWLNKAWFRIDEVLYCDMPDHSLQKNAQTGFLPNKEGTRRGKDAQQKKVRIPINFLKF